MENDEFVDILNAGNCMQNIKNLKEKFTRLKRHKIATHKETIQNIAKTGVFLLKQVA